MKITQQPPIIYGRPSVGASPVSPPAEINKDRQQITPEQPFVERRKKRDRRNRSTSRGPFDMRSGRGRRKDDSIDVDV